MKNNRGSWPLRGSVALLALLGATSTHAATLEELLSRVDQEIRRVEPDVVSLRQHIHQFPELGFQEKNTARLVAQQLRELGFEVRTGVAKTGVVAVLRGGKPGPVLALRSELDALPIVEQTGLPYASKQKAVWEGESVGVMHACGHDAHIAILLGVAKALAPLRGDLAGSVKFIFQPAEEGGQTGEPGGARQMIAEGALENPKPEAIFTLHVGAGPKGTLSIKSGPTTAGSDNFAIRVKGEQTHAASPARGVDPVPLAAQIILGLQTIPSRQTSAPPPLITVSRIDAGFRWNIIPPEVLLRGTLRSLNAEQRTDAIERIQRTATKIAESGGGSAEVEIFEGNAPGYNNPELVTQVIPILDSIGQEGKVKLNQGGSVGYVADDFSDFAHAVPGVGFGLGVAPNEARTGPTGGNHSPYFVVDDTALAVGVRAFTHIILNYFDGRITLATDTTPTKAAR